MSKRATELNATRSQIGNESVSGADKKSLKKSSIGDEANRSMTNMNVTEMQNFKYEIPPSCFVTMMKKALIEKMREKFFLSSHPYPKLDGELIVFRPRK